MWRVCEVGDPVDVIITPEKGLHVEIGRQLLELAEDPRQVRWVSWPQAGYKVPVELAEKLKGVRSLPNTEQAATEQVTTEQVTTDQVVTKPAPQPQEQAPRRRGRPRKQVEPETVPSTDDTEKEE
jgi:hypothetical protein